MQKMIHLPRKKSGTSHMPAWFAILLSGLISALVISGCSMDKPSAPSWDVDVTVPLLSKTYTMDQIAEEVDISKGTLYNYFPFKESIISEYWQKSVWELKFHLLQMKMEIIHLSIPKNWWENRCV